MVRAWCRRRVVGWLVLSTLPLACYRGTDPWLDRLPAFTCPRDPAPEIGQRRGARAPEPGLPGLPFSRDQRACPRLAAGGPESVGTATEGILCGGARLEPDEGQPFVLLPSTARRGTTCGTTRLVKALRAAAAKVAAAHPGLRLPLGNVARCGGGDLPWSVSHNTGRDADLYFYMRSDDGRQHLPEKVAPIDLRDLAIDDGSGPYRFVVDANLDLVLALAADADVDVQWIFVANSVRKALLDRARERKIAPRQIARLAEILHQPRKALPHDDHFHVRVRCTSAERRTGCLDLPRGPDDAPGPDDEPVRELVKRATKGAGRERDTVLDLLWALGARGVLPALVDGWSGFGERARLILLAQGAREPGEVRAHERLARLVHDDRSPRVVRHAIDLAFRRLHEKGGVDRLAAWARRRDAFTDPDDPFYTFRPECVVVEVAARRGNLQLLQRLLAQDPRPCADRPEAWDRLVRWLTGFEPAAYEKQARKLAGLSTAEVRVRALHARGLLPSLRPTDADLLAAVSSTEDDAAYGACRLLLVRLSRDPDACDTDAVARVALVRKALRR